MKVKYLSTLALSIISMHVYAETVKQDPTTLFLQRSITRFMEKNHIPGVAVQLYVNGKLYEHYDGYADREKKDPVIKKTIFELGSISKIMTSVLFAQEVDW